MKRDNHYSRVIAWLRVLLPLAALMLLSTVFLFSKDAPKVGKLPFSDREIEDRAANKQITAPHFFGTTANGDTIALQAEAARPDPDQEDSAIGQGISGSLTSIKEGSVDIAAGEIDLDLSAESAILSGGVRVETSTGYKMSTDRMRTSLNRVDAETLGPVTGTAPAGQISAGRMLISTDPDTGALDVLFTEGVKLIYEPQLNKE